MSTPSNSDLVAATASVLRGAGQNPSDFGVGGPAEPVVESPSPLVSQGEPEAPVVPQPAPEPIAAPPEHDPYAPSETPAPQLVNQPAPPAPEAPPEPSSETNPGDAFKSVIADSRAYARSLEESNARLVDEKAKADAFRESVEDDIRQGNDLIEDQTKRMQELEEKAATVNAVDTAYTRYLAANGVEIDQAQLRQIYNEEMSRHQQAQIPHTIDQKVRDAVSDVIAPLQAALANQGTTPTAPSQPAAPAAPAQPAPQQTVFDRYPAIADFRNEIEWKAGQTGIPVEEAARSYILAFAGQDAVEKTAIDPAPHIAPGATPTPPAADRYQELVKATEGKGVDGVIDVLRAAGF